MLGGGVEFKALQQAARGAGFERFVERSGGMGVEIVLDQHNLFGLGKMLRRQGPQALGVIYARLAFPATIVDVLVKFTFGDAESLHLFVGPGRHGVPDGSFHRCQLRGV